jgi:hypothetical protein
MKRKSIKIYLYIRMYTNIFQVRLECFKKVSSDHYLSKKPKRKKHKKQKQTKQILLFENNPTKAV